jgi:hypothetical protein
MTHLRVKGSWGGWARDRVIELNDGSIWRQDEDLYECRYAHQPSVVIENGRMSVKGMKRPVKVQRVS